MNKAAPMKTTRAFGSQGNSEQHPVVFRSNISACPMAEANNESKVGENTREGLEDSLPSPRQTRDGIDNAERGEQQRQYVHPPSPCRTGGGGQAPVGTQYHSFQRVLMTGLNISTHGQGRDAGVNVQVETLDANRDTGVELRTKLDLRDVLLKSVGQLCGFNDLANAKAWWWRFSVLVVLVLVITTFWAFGGSEMSISAFALAAASSLASVLCVTTQSGVSATFLTHKASSAVRTPLGGHQERLFRESGRRGGRCLGLVQLLYGPVLLVLSLLDTLLVGTIGQGVDDVWVCNTGWISLGGRVQVGTIVRKQRRYKDYGSGIRSRGVKMFDGRLVWAVGRGNEKNSVVAYFSGLSDLWEYLGCQKCWIVFGHHRALRCYNGSRYTTLALHSRNSRTLFMKSVEDLPGIMVEVHKCDLALLDLEVFVAASYMYLPETENYTMNLAVRSGMEFRHVLRDVSAVRVEGVTGSANCHVLDGLGCSGANLNEVDWDQLLRYRSDEWVTEWVNGYTGGQASEVDIYLNGHFVRTVALASTRSGGTFPVAVLVGKGNSVVTLNKDYGQVVAFEKSGTYVKAHPVDCNDPFKNGRCYKDMVPEGAGLMLQVPGAKPGLWHRNDAGEIVMGCRSILPLLC